MVAALLLGSGLASGSSSTTISSDLSTVSKAKQVEHAEAVSIRRAQEAEAEYIAWAVAEERRQADEALLAFAAEVERQAHEAWHAEQDRIAAEKARQAAATAPKATSSSAYGAGASTGPCAGWEGLIASYFPAEQVANACRVMMCESGGNPNAKNSGSSASGLFQFLDGTWESTTGTPAPARAYDPATQVAAAAKLWRSSGWAPWSCR